MNYSKTVIATIVLLSLFTAGCLFGTYTIAKDVEKMIAAPVANKQIRDGLQKRFEMLQQQSLVEFNKTSSLAFNDFFPSRDYFDNIHQELNNIFEENRKEMYELNSKAVRSSNFMVDNTDKEFKVSAILQNVNKEMLKVVVNRGFLIVTASQENKVKEQDSKEAKDSKEVKKEQRYSSFKKVIKLPRNVDLTKATASYKENVLVVAFPKTELKDDKPMEIKIN